MFHGSVMGKIISPVEITNEERPSGCTRKKATYTLCTGKDGLGKNKHFCIMDMVAIGGVAHKAEKKLKKVIMFMLFFTQKQLMRMVILSSMLMNRRR